MFWLHLWNGVERLEKVSSVFNVVVDRNAIVADYFHGG